MIVLRNKNFARVDYEGLTEEGKASLKAQRDLRAQRLNQIRKNNNDLIKRNGKKHTEAYTKLRNELHGKTLANEAIEQEKIRNSVIDKFGKEPKEHIGKAPKSVQGVKENIGRDAVNIVKSEGKSVAKKGLKLGKAGKIAAIAGGAAVATGAGALAYKKHKEQKQFTEEKDNSVRNAAIAGAGVTGVGLGLAHLRSKERSRNDVFKHAVNETNIHNSAIRDARQGLKDSAKKFASSKSINEENFKYMDNQYRQYQNLGYEHGSENLVDHYQKRRLDNKKDFLKKEAENQEFMTNAKKKYRESVSSAKARYNNNMSKEAVNKIRKGSYAKNMKNLGAKAAGVGVAAGTVAYLASKKKKD